MSATVTSTLERLHRVDLVFLAIFSFIVFGWGLVVPKTLNAHETIGCVNTREMLASGDLIIPTYGGRPWLERPPLPFWINSVVILATDGVNKDWAYRLPPIFVAVIGVLLTSWIGSLVFGRLAGVMSGCILTTMYEYFIYAKGPESDIFLATVVIAALATFARSECVAKPQDDRRFWGIRPLHFLGSPI